MKTQEKKNKVISGVLLAIFAISALLATFFAYDQYNQKLKMENQLGVEQYNMDQHLATSFTLIEKNLSEINAREGQIQMDLDGKSKEGTDSPEERIQREIAMIEGLIADNKAIIKSLNSEVGSKNKELASYNNKLLKLNKRVKSYREQAAELEGKNALLTESLKTVADENVELTLDNEQKDMFISDQQNELERQREQMSTAYYVVGDFKELKDAEIVEKEGGIVGIAATKTIKENFDKKDFVKIDLRSYKTIPVFSKEASLISNHHPDSYEWIKENKQVKYIKIINPNLFWENGKYLVVETDDGWDLSLANNK